MKDSKKQNTQTNDQKNEDGICEIKEGVPLYLVLAKFLDYEIPKDIKEFYRL